MTTAVYRVSRVVTGSSPVARIDATDADGHELRLEVPRPLAEQVAAGHLLVLQWSLHDPPGMAPEVAGPSETKSTAPSTGTPATVPSDPAVVDQEFMEMMARGRRTNAPSSAAPSRSIDSELSTLLGSAGAKGQK